MQAIPNKRIFFAFLLPFLFWTYLAFSSEMNIAFDATGFENAGKILQSEGFSGYLKNSPQKEPLYAYTISWSMRIADVFHVDYKKVQTCFQILLLFLGQIFLYQVLLILKKHEKIITIALLYYGFSPALVNCGFSLYSEIVTLPLILMSVFFLNRAWCFLLREEIKPVVTYALFFTFSATLAAFSKAALTILYPLLISPFTITLALSLVKGRRKQRQCAIIFLLIFFSIFYASISGYKSLNKKYHGVYTFTDDRGGPMLYTLAFKRTAPLTKDFLGMSLSSVPGQNICRTFYGDQACYQWFFDGSANLGLQKAHELADKLPQERIHKMLILSSIKQISSNPLQYSFFTFLEALKLFFWESTQGFVSYPLSMTTLYNNSAFKNSLRLVVSLATFFSVIYTAIYLFKNRRKIVQAGKEHERHSQLFFLFFFLILFIGFYALVMTVTRYSLPIAPLFIALIAFTIHEKSSKNKL